MTMPQLSPLIGEKLEDFPQFKPYIGPRRGVGHTIDKCITCRLYSETCIRRSPLGPVQLPVIQRWPAYKDCIENYLILYIVVYIAIALTNFDAQVTSGLLTLEDFTTTKALSCQL